MNKKVLVLIASAFFKAIPLVQGLIVTNVAGAEYYATIGYYFISSLFISTIITAGFVPSYITETTDDIGVEKIVTKYVYAFMVSCVVVLVLSFIAWFFGLLGNKSILVLFVLGVSTALNNALLPILFASGVVSYCLLFTIISLVVNVFVSLLSVMMVVDVFQYVAVLPSVVLSVALLVKYLGGLHVIYNVSKWEYMSSFVTVSKLVAPVLVPNIMWMGAIFLFSHKLDSGLISKDDFSWYVIGLQLFGLFVFIPNALSPIMLKHIAAVSSCDGRKLALRVSVIIFFTSLIVFVLAGSIAVYAEFFGMEIYNMKSLSIIIFTGVVVSIMNPLSNYLIAEKKTKYIGLAGLSWAIVAHVGLLLDSANYALIYFVAYVVSILILLMSVRFFSINP